MRRRKEYLVRLLEIMSLTISGGGDGRQNDANFNSDVWHTKMFNNSNGYKTTKANQLSGGNKLIKGLNKQS